MKSPRRTSAVAVAIVAVLGLAACTSNPSAKAVAEDVVESLPDLTAAERTCMLAAIDRYGNDELQDIGEANETVDFSQPGAVESQGTPELKRFVADLDNCRDGA